MISHSQNPFRLVVLISIIAIWQSCSVAQEKNSKNTLTLKKDGKSPKASIKDVAWIAGHWKGEAMGGQFEETWNSPMAGSMMGMFKHVKNSEVNFYELLTIVEQDGSILLRLKHFGKTLQGWEEKDKSVEFPLVKLTENEAFFDGLTFRKIDDNTLHIFVVVGQKNGESQELRFACSRAVGNKTNRTLATGSEENTEFADAIRFVYDVDRVIAKQRDVLPEKETLSVAIRTYVAGLDAIDFEECPTDFVAAFKAHRDAWHASQAFFQQFDDLHGEMHDLFDEIRAMKGARQSEMEKHFKAIMDTWSRVESVAKRFGVGQ